MWCSEKARGERVAGRKVEVGTLAWKLRWRRGQRGAGYMSNATPRASEEVGKSKVQGTQGRLVGAYGTEDGGIDSSDIALQRLCHLRRDV